MKHQTAAMQIADAMQSMRFCGDVSRHLTEEQARALHRSSFGKVMIEVSKWRRGRLSDGEATLDFGDEKYLIWQFGSECAVVHRQAQRGVIYGSAFIGWKVEQGTLQCVVAKLLSSASAKQRHLPLAVPNCLA